MSLRIILGVEALSTEPTGIGRYAWELVKRLPEEAKLDRVDFYRHGRIVPNPSLLLAQASLPKSRMPRRVRNMIARYRLRGGLYHGPNFLLPDEVDSGVITIHDLSVFRFPEFHPADRVAHFERHLRSSLERSRHIITPSETIRKEVLDFAPVDENRVTAVAMGVDSEFSRPIEGDRQAAILARHALVPDGYILCVATLEPRKRIDAAIDACLRVRERFGIALPLVIAGGSGWHNDDLHRHIERASRKGAVKLLGFVPDSELSALYQGARLFLYPSVYEGFGMPPIEAMASGVPVIVSDRSCLPEVTQGHAKYVDPDDTEQFAEKIAQALEDEKWRNAVREAGRSVAAGYSWKRCAKETAAVYWAAR